jgi:hypothetical protein
MNARNKENPSFADDLKNMGEMVLGHFLNTECGKAPLSHDVSRKHDSASGREIAVT